MNQTTRPILLIEDDIGLKELLTEVLSEFASHVVAVDTATDAIQWLTANDPLLMILDYSLPDMNGHDFILELKNKNITTPAFIVSTGQGDEKIAVEMMKLGARDYIIKDYNFLELLPLVVRKAVAEIENNKQLRKAEKTLNELNQFNLQIVQSVSEGIIVYDKNMRYQVWNPFMENLTGIPASEIIGKHPLDFFPFLKAEGVINNIEKALLGEITIEKEFMFYVPQTKKKGWASDFTSPLYDSKKNIIGAITTVRDITDRIRTNNELNLKEQKYQELFNSLLDVYYQADMNGIILGISPSVKKITGHTREELIRTPINRLYNNPSDRLLLIEELMKGGELREKEIQIRTKDGTIRYAVVNVKLMHDANGYPTHINGVFRDITEKKLIELKLHESEYFFKESQRAGRIGSYKTDFITGFWQSSDVLDQIFGIDKDYLRDVPGWLEIVHPDDRQMMYNYLIEEVITNQKIFDKEYRIVRKSDGETRWVKGMGEPSFNTDGEIVSLIGTIMDITDKIIAIQQVSLLSRAVEQSTVSVVITSKKGDIEYVNPKFTEVTGYAFEEAKGNNPRILKSGEQNDEFYKELWDTISTGKDWSGEFHNRKKNGQSYWESAVISPIFSANGEIEYYLAVKEDITDKKRMTDELIRAKKKAEESDQLKSAFLQNISHEIRTPMNSIIGFSTLLQKPDLSAEKQQSYTSIIINNTNQMLSIYNDIITISAIETNQEKAFFQKTIVNNILKEVYEIFITHPATKKIKFTFKSRLSDNRSEIYCDQDKLKQILSNLINNAFKFTKNGKIEFGYKTDFQVSDGGKPKLVFYVKDTGIGIDSEFHTKIFERFFQVDHEITRRYGGNGIGLSISKGFVELLGGEIWVDSMIGKGSIFYFSIPYLPAKKKRQKTQRKTNLKTILIAEDEIINYQLLEEILLDLKCKLLHAKDGKEAIDICRKNPKIDLVLMDVKMPNVDGQQAAKAIKQFRPSLPIIAQTAYTIDNNMDEFDGVFDNYITKPISVEELRRMISELFAIQAQEVTG